MINIITALLNENINYKLKEKNEFYIKYDDIQYEEGLLEIIEKEKNINYLIISEKIIEKNNIEEILNIIKKINNKIKIILLIEDIKKIEKINQKILKIINYNKNKESDEKLINKIINIIYEEEKIINEENIIDELKAENKKAQEEIKKLREIINNKKNKGKIITIIGESGTGKTTISAVLANELSNKWKTLLIDMDFINKDIHILFNKKLYEKAVDKNIVRKINNNLDIISDMDLVIKKSKNNIKNNIENKLNLLFEKIIEKYEYIIIDLNKKVEKIIFNYFLKKSDKLFLLIEGNIIGLNRGKKYYEEILKSIQKNQIKIIINKKNKYSINSEIIKNILKNTIYAEINYDKKINKIINENLKNKIENKNIKKIIQKIKKEN